MAETLITLTIIGVIAALTIPNLLNKYTKHTYVVGLKKAYAQLQHAMKMIPITEGCSAGDYYCAGVFEDNFTGTNTSINRQNAGITLSKNLKVQKLCIGPYVDCFGNNYSYQIENHADEFAGTHSTNILLQDGMLITLGTRNIYVDVNGIKGPNKTGRDIFGFEIITTDNEYTYKGNLIPIGSNLYKKINNYGYITCVDSDGIVDGTHAYGCTGKVLEEDAMNY